MAFYKPTDIIHKIDSAFAMKLRVSIGAIEGLPPSTKMSKFLGTNTLEDVVYDVAGFLAENPQTRPIGDAITHYSDSNSTIDAFHKSVLKAMENVPVPEKKTPMTDKDIEKEKHNLLLAAEKRKLGNLSNGVRRSAWR